MQLLLLHPTSTYSFSTPTSLVIEQAPDKQVKQGVEEEEEEWGVEWEEEEEEEEEELS